ncbi:MAG: hypothetical protein ABL997_21265, partial [Planctomycetota bacterium]
MEIAALLGCSVRMSSAPWKGLVRWLPVALGLLLMVGLLAWLMGAFRTRVVPSGPALPPQLAAGVPLHTVAMRRVPRTETAVGTIRAVRETAVEVELGLV